VPWARESVPVAADHRTMIVSGARCRACVASATFARVKNFNQMEGRVGTFRTPVKPHRQMDQKLLSMQASCHVALTCQKSDTKRLALSQTRLSPVDQLLSGARVEKLHLSSGQTVAI